MGNKLDDRAKTYIKDVQAAGTPIDTTVVMASGEAIVRRSDKMLLKENDGPIDITKSWAKPLLSRIGYVKRKACSTAKVEPLQYEEQKGQYLYFRHNGRERCQACRLFGTRRQIANHYCDLCNTKWIFSAFPSIYQGKTPAGLPGYSFPEDWNVTYTPNHWSNEEKTQEYTTKVILPYIKGNCSELKLQDDQPALVSLKANSQMLCILSLIQATFMWSKYPKTVLSTCN